jgi:hypothetical protein
VVEPAAAPAGAPASDAADDWTTSLPRSGAALLLIAGERGLKPEDRLRKREGAQAADLELQAAI